MKPVVFLGPSLPLDKAKNVLNATYLPPCAMGDVYRCVQKKVTAIVIIDGFFEQRPAVWHKEILYAISQGIPVFGGSSMGALRAAELHAFGMLGVGDIFEAYASGIIEDDDEVAVVHTDRSDGYRPISEAMVNIRAGLKQALLENIVSEGEMNSLVELAKSKFYPERNWALILKAAKTLLSGERFDRLYAKITGDNPPNQKRDDAVSTLKYVAEMLTNGLEPQKVTFNFEPTCFWDRVVEEFSSIGEEQDGHEVNVHIAQLRNHVRLFAKEREGILNDALLLSLAYKNDKKNGQLSIDTREAMIAFRRKRHLDTPESLRQWMKANEVDESACLMLVEMEHVLNRVLQNSGSQVDKHLLMALKLSGRYEELVKHVSSKWAYSEGMEMAQLFTSNDSHNADIINWYQKHHSVIHSDVKRHAETLGVASEKEFMDELLRELNFQGSVS
jgi:hypothetical protein